MYKNPKNNGINYPTSSGFPALKPFSQNLRKKKMRQSFEESSDSKGSIAELGPLVGTNFFTPSPLAWRSGVFFSPRGGGRVTPEIYHMVHLKRSLLEVR